MKIPLTEETLWKIYNFVDKLDEKIESDFFQGLFQPKSYIWGPGIQDEAYWHIKDKFERKYPRQQFSRIISSLKKHGWIKVKSLENKEAIIFTPKGKEKLLQIAIRQNEKTKRKRRDNKWQMVIFDIPEKYRKTRNRFRSALKLLGYQKLQQSVWICPYDVLKETQTLVRYYSIESYIRLLLVQEMEIS